MAPLQPSEGMTKDTDPVPPPTSNTDIAMEEAPLGEAPNPSHEKPNEATFAGFGRRDSVLADDTPTFMLSKNRDIQGPTTGYEVSPGDFVLNTASASSKASPTPKSRQTPNLGQSIFKTPPATRISKTPETPPLKTAGSLWVLKYDSKAWPVIICDETSTPEQFMNQRSNRIHLPAILLGKRTYIWVVDKHLKSFDRDKNYLIGCAHFDSEDLLSGDDAATKIEKLRQRGFRRDALHGGSHEFWANVLRQERSSRHLEEIRRGMKRRWQEHDGLRAAQKGSFVNKGTSQDREKPVLFSKRRRWSPLRGFRLREEGEADPDDSLLSFDKPADDQERIQASYKRDLERVKGTCKVFVGAGQNKTTFEVPNSALAQCVELSRLVHYTDGRQKDSYIKLFETHDIDVESFKPIATFLVKGSFAPHLVKGREGPVLEGVRTKEDADNAAQRLGQIYYTASRLHFGEVQQYCVEKFDYLPALSPLGLRIVVACFRRAAVHDCPAERDMEQWLLAQISGSFRELMMERGPAFVELLRENDGLRLAVIREVARRERASIVEDEDEVGDASEESEDMEDDDDDDDD